MKEEEQELPECNLFVWVLMSDESLFKHFKKCVNKRFRWKEKDLPFFPTPWFVYDDKGWCTPLGFAISFNRHNLIGSLLKHGANVDEHCLGFDSKAYTLRPIEIMHFIPHDKRRMFLRRNPSIEFYSGCREALFHRLPNLGYTVCNYIWQKRMYALCFCLTSMGQSWPDLAWIMKDFLL